MFFYLIVTNVYINVRKIDFVYLNDSNIYYNQYEKLVLVLPSITFFLFCLYIYSLRLLHLAISLASATERKESSDKREKVYNSLLFFRVFFYMTTIFPRHTLNKEIEYYHWYYFRLPAVFLYRLYNPSTSSRSMYIYKLML